MDDAKRLMENIIDNVTYFNTEIETKYEMKLTEIDNCYALSLINVWNGEEKWLASCVDTDLLPMFIYTQGFVKAWHIKDSDF